MADLVFIWITDTGHVNPEHIYLVLNAIHNISVTEREEKEICTFILQQTRNFMFTREGNVNDEENTEFTIALVSSK